MRAIFANASATHHSVGIARSDGNHSREEATHACGIESCNQQNSQARQLHLHKHEKLQLIPDLRTLQLEPFTHLQDSLNTGSRMECFSGCDCFSLDKNENLQPRHRHLKKTVPLPFADRSKPTLLQRRRSLKLSRKSLAV